MNITELFNNAVIPLVPQMIELAKARNGSLEPFQDNAQDLQFLSRMFQFMKDEDLALFAGAGYLVSQAVADYLTPRIKSLDHKGRIALGEKMNYWRIWKKIVETPGLTEGEIRSIRTTYKCD